MNIKPIDNIDSLARDHTAQRHSVWRDTFEEIADERPGEWVEVEHSLKPTSLSPLASRVRSGKHPSVQGFAPGAFEVRVAQGRMFVRYKG